MLYESDTWPIKEGNVIRIEKNGAMKFMCMYNAGRKVRNSSVEFTNRLQLNPLGKYLQDRRLTIFNQCFTSIPPENIRKSGFYDLEKMEESSYPSKRRKSEALGRLPKRIPRKTWSEAIKRNMEKWKVSKRLRFF